MIRRLFARVRYALQRFAIFCRLAHWSAPVMVVRGALIVAPGVLKLSAADRETARSYGYTIIEDPHMPARRFEWGRLKDGDLLKPMTAGSVKPDPRTLN